MSAKDQFLRNKDLAGKWNQFSKSPDWELVKIHALAMITETAPTREMLQGMMLAFHTLDAMAENTDTPFEWPSPGIIHNLEKPKESYGNSPDSSTTDPNPGTAPTSPRRTRAKG